eukprot:COSAG04_NODE_2036_length_4958_cov_2.183165_2_plen_211_part_00
MAGLGRCTGGARADSSGSGGASRSRSQELRLRRDGGRVVLVRARLPRGGAARAGGRQRRGARRRSGGGAAAGAGGGARAGAALPRVRVGDGAVLAELRERVAGGPGGSPRRHHVGASPSSGYSYSIQTTEQDVQVHVAVTNVADVEVVVDEAAAKFNHHGLLVLRASLRHLAERASSVGSVAISFRWGQRATAGAMLPFAQSAIRVVMLS